MFEEMMNASVLSGKKPPLPSLPRICKLNSVFSISKALVWVQCFNGSYQNNPNSYEQNWVTTKNYWYQSRSIYSKVTYSGYLRQTQGLAGNSKPYTYGFVSVIEMMKNTFLLLFNCKTILCHCNSFAWLARFMNLAQ